MKVRGNYVREQYRDFEIKDSVINEILKVKEIQTVSNINLLVSRDKDKATVIISGVKTDGTNSIVVTNFPKSAIVDE